jgi:hypothetical protein
MGRRQPGTSVACARRGDAIGRRTPGTHEKGMAQRKVYGGRSGSLSSRLRASTPQPAMAGPAREEDHGFT